MFDFGSQHLEIFFLPVVPTEHLDRFRQPQIPTTLHTVVGPGPSKMKRIAQTLLMNILSENALESRSDELHH